MFTLVDEFSKDIVIQSNTIKEILDKLNKLPGSCYIIKENDVVIMFVTTGFGYHEISFAE